MLNAMLVITGVVLAEITNRSVRWWQSIEDQRLRAEAKDILAKHGMSPELYLPSLGTKDQDLRWAMSVFDMTGYVVLNADQDIIGKIVPNVAMRTPKLKPVKPTN